MSVRSLFTLVALAGAIALVPAAAQAKPASEIVFDVENFGVPPASCPATDLFGLGFDMLAPGGTALGTGQSCVHSIKGCDPFVPFCRDRIDATFTLNLAGGTITSEMTLREVWPSEAEFIQVAKGRITGGSGDYEGARGRVSGGGSAEFTATGVLTDLTYTVALKG